MSHGKVSRADRDSRRRGDDSPIHFDSCACACNQFYGRKTNDLRHCGAQGSADCRGLIIGQCCWQRTWRFYFCANCQCTRSGVPIDKGVRRSQLSALAPLPHWVGSFSSLCEIRELADFHFFLPVAFAWLRALSLQNVDTNNFGSREWLWSPAWKMFNHIRCNIFIFNTLLSACEVSFVSCASTLGK
jgi:hypothetical protein